jgi:hypothetical protein
MAGAHSDKTRAGAVIEMPTMCRLCASDPLLHAHRHEDLGDALNRAMTRSTVFEQECDAKDETIAALRAALTEALDLDSGDCDDLDCHPGGSLARPSHLCERCTTIARLRKLTVIT